MSYAELTVLDRNIVKRWLQRRRFADALALSRDTLRHNARVMDFGPGDGELFRLMLDEVTVEPWLYEPVPYLMAEAQTKLAEHDTVRFVDDLGAVPHETFDFIFCLEVLEHLPQKKRLRRSQISASCSNRVALH